MNKYFTSLLCIIALSIPGLAWNMNGSTAKLKEMLIGGCIYFFLAHIGCVYAGISGKKVTRIVFGVLYAPFLLCVIYLTTAHNIFILISAFSLVFFYYTIIKVKTSKSSATENSNNKKTDHN